MHSNPDTIEVVEQSSDGATRLALKINGKELVLLTKRGQEVRLHWQVYGPMQWQEAHVLLQGLLELSIHADRLSAPEPKKRKGRGNNEE